jgi:hypothetical protein
VDSKEKKVVRSLEECSDLEMGHVTAQGRKEWPEDLRASAGGSFQAFEGLVWAPPQPHLPAALHLPPS